MGFFGLVVGPGKEYTVTVSQGRRLHLTSACVDASEGDDLVSLQATVDSSNYIVAVLGQGTYMCNLDLVFGHKQKVLLSTDSNKRSVHLSGYFEEDGALFLTEQEGLEEFGDDLDGELED
eukprot:Sspe_Gene.88811::Locus_60727_Transcript_1_1_Confidence_1.000_Length_401::g.88811::m.88811